MPFEIRPWSEISDRFNDTLLLGNGASIAVDDRFRYQSLKQHAIDNGLFNTDVQSLFDFFHTDDFELILRIVWQATNVNKALEIDDQKTEQSYRHVRDCLIAAVRNIHPEHGAVSDKLPEIAKYMKGFKKIVSLNYDLIVYWAMMYGNELKNRHMFKDCFVGSEFDDDWSRFGDAYGNHDSCSLVFYPHGNLIFARDKLENERKISSGADGLLESVLQKWERGSYVPLFVSEGTKQQKQKSIQSSYYLNTVYREVLTSVQDSLVVFGWGVGEHDLHIIERAAKSNVRRIAFSVFGDDQGYCNRVSQLVRDEFQQPCEVFFFDAESLECWTNA
ncbi:DUF4917 family protein [Halomonas ventosae]|uniref:Uncharacterized protein DUF4917 n=1 Tax=Halomonas ventosae TaxID=229007 RepID=A0A2T0VK83_9GAMM|nr:DUF4917 family protein [Halomonas ventosae]PRY70640.1 uncharacterized protein DUF4917 [Halomonas ventosae]